MAENTEKNMKIKETYATTQLRRKGQVCRVFTCKVQKNHLSRKQRETLRMMFLEAKWMYNYVLNLSKQENTSVFSLNYKDLVHITHLDKDGNAVDVTLQYLSSQMRQAVLEGIYANIRGLAKAKERGSKVGKLRFISEYRSINLKQAGSTHKILSKNRVKVQGISKPLRVRGLEQILSLEEYELANAKLVERYGEWYVAFTVYTVKQRQEEDNKCKPIIGIDLGCQTSVTLSDGRKYDCRVQESEYCKRLRRKISRCEHNSKNRYRLKRKYGKASLKTINRRDDFARQLNHILKDYTVVMQDEQIRQWSRMRHGKAVQNGILGRIKALLAKEESTVVLSKWFPTTKLCTECGELVSLKLNERTFVCPVCGDTEDRDVHAAKNMVWLYENITCAERIHDFAGVQEALGVIFPPESCDKRGKKPLNHESV